MLADIDRAAADVDVGVADGTDDLRQGDVVSVELVQIDFDLIFLAGTAPGIDLNHAGHGQQSPLQHPVLDRAKVGQAEVRRPDQLVAVNLADQAGALDLRRNAIGKIDVLLQINLGLGQSEIIIDAVLKHDANEGEAVERSRANDIHTWRCGETDLEGDGVVALHLFRGLTGGLSGDLEDHRGGIRIRLDIEL